MSFFLLLSMYVGLVLKTSWKLKREICIMFCKFPFRLLVVRKVRDSNPRYSKPYSGFRVRPVRPLRQLSLFKGFNTHTLMCNKPLIYKSREEMWWNSELIGFECSLLFVIHRHEGYPEGRGPPLKSEAFSVFRKKLMSIPIDPVSRLICLIYVLQIYQ